MKYKLLSYDRYHLKTPLITLFLDKIKNKNIEILELKNIKENEYKFTYN